MAKCTRTALVTKVVCTKARVGVGGVSLGVDFLVLLLTPVHKCSRGLGVFGANVHCH